MDGVDDKDDDDKEEGDGHKYDGYAGVVAVEVSEKGN
jgi:hypothetical protein